MSEDLVLRECCVKMLPLELMGEYTETWLRPRIPEYDVTEPPTTAERHRAIVNEFSCDYCIQTFATRVQRDKHQDNHATKLNKTRLKEHVNTHLGLKPHTCPHCNASFAVLRNFRIHLVFHARMKPFNCSLSHCGKLFSSKDELKAHSLTHKDDKPFICSQCNKSFSRQAYLNKHILSHGEKRYSCCFCPKGFSFSSNLKKHLSCHTGVKAFFCTKCNKSFSREEYLKKHHRRTHSEVDRPYSCDFCPKRFLKNDTFKKHLVYHARVKPYQCLHCDKAFSQRGNLTTHTRRHTGEKPHSCCFCSKRFISNSDLIRHSHIHSGELAS